MQCAWQGCCLHDWVIIIFADDGDRWWGTGLKRLAVQNLHNVVLTMFSGDFSWLRINRLICAISEQCADLLSGKSQVNTAVYVVWSLACLWQFYEIEVNVMKLLNKHHFALLFAAFLASASPCLAGTSAMLHVGATIKPWMKFNSTQHVATYQVNSEDLKKGYIDLANVITVNLSTNQSKGVRVLVENSGAGEVMLKESGAADFSASSFTVSPTDYRAGTQISKQYDSRITLPVDAKVGTYPLLLTLMPTI